MSSTHDALDYHAFLQDALRSVVRRALTLVARTGLPGGHHFYITFATEAPEVGLSQELRDRYPEHMTIVIQHDYRDLEVDESGFSITLRFSGAPHRISIPFSALVSFYDPSEQFALRFDAVNGEEADEAPTPMPTIVDRDSPRPPVRAVLAAADRMAEEKAAEERTQELEALEELPDEGGTADDADEEGRPAKSRAKRAPAKKPAAKKAAARKAPAKKAPAKKRPTKASPAKAGPAKTSTAKGAAAKKTPAKGAAAKKTPAKAAKGKAAPATKAGTRKATAAGKKVSAKESAQEEKTAATDPKASPTESDKPSKGGVVISFEDFRRR